MGQTTLTLGVTGYDAHCNGSTDGSAKVIPSGGVAPYTFAWAPVTGITDSISGLIAGVYSVTVTDSTGATATVSVTINQPDPLTVIIDSNVVRPCFRTTGGACGCYNSLWAIVGGGTPPYSYLWTPGGTTDDTLSNVCYIEFTVNVTDANGCIVTDSLDITVPVTHITITTGVGEVSNTIISTYPNPAASTLNISLSESVTDTRDLTIYNIIGEKVFEQKVNGNEQIVPVDVAVFPSGNYLIKITGDVGQETSHFSVVR